MKPFLFLHACVESEYDSLGLVERAPKKRKAAKQAALGNQRIDSYDPNTPMGELRAFEDIKSIPVTESLLKKVNEKVKLVKPKPQIKKKKKKKKKAKDKSQKKLSDFWGTPKKKRA